MVEAIRDQWVIVLAIVVVIGLTGWLVAGRWVTAGLRRRRRADTAP